MEDEERWTAGGTRQPAYGYSSNVQRLDESFQPQRERCGVMRDRVGATGGSDVVLACGEMRRIVVLRFARLMAPVLWRPRGTVRFSGKLADVPADDENRRENKQPFGHEPRILGDPHHGGAYRAAPLVSRNRIAPSRMLPSGNRRAIGDVTFPSLWRQPS